eukprot:5175926-Amphidinium_carterae.1
MSLHPFCFNYVYSILDDEFVGWVLVFKARQQPLTRSRQAECLQHHAVHLWQTSIPPNPRRLKQNCHRRSSWKAEVT